MLGLVTALLNAPVHRIWAPAGRDRGRALNLPLFEETYSVSRLCAEVS